jgi:hypothetical protein
MWQRREESECEHTGRLKALREQKARKLVEGNGCPFSEKQAAALGAGNLSNFRDKYPSKPTPVVWGGGPVFNSQVRAHPFGFLLIIGVSSCVMHSPLKIKIIMNMVMPVN